MGGNVAPLDIQKKPMEEFRTLSSKFGVKTFYIQADVTVKKSLYSGFDKAVEQLGSLHGCVPAVEIAIDKPFSSRRGRSVRGVFFIVQLVAKQIVKQGGGGSIVLIASQSVHIALPGYRLAAYNACKGGVLMLARALGVELAPKNIRVNTISPGLVDSEASRRVFEAKSNREGEQMWISPPMQRLSTPNDLTGAVIYLLSDASRHTTAADTQITGGLHAGTIDELISYKE